MVIYKYLKREFLERFKEEGSICIGNIKWYREIESEKIRDPHEGRTTYLLNTGEESIELSVEQVNAITNDYYISVPLKVNPHTYFCSDLKVPNAFVFSTSSRLDEELMSYLGYDAYYSISNIKQFLNAVSDELNKHHKLLFSLAHKVRYVPTKTIRVTNSNKDAIIRTTPYDKSKSDRMKTIYVEDYLTKSQAFEKEEEFRLIFITATPIGREPVYLSSRKFTEYCEF